MWDTTAKRTAWLTRRTCCLRVSLRRQRQDRPIRRHSLCRPVRMIRPPTCVTFHWGKIAVENSIYTRKTTSRLKPLRSWNLNMSLPKTRSFDGYLFGSVTTRPMIIEPIKISLGMRIPWQIATGTVFTTPLPKIYWPIPSRRCGLRTWRTTVCITTEPRMSHSHEDCVISTIFTWRKYSWSRSCPKDVPWSITRLEKAETSRNGPISSPRLSWVLTFPRIIFTTKRMVRVFDTLRRSGSNGLCLMRSFFKPIRRCSSLQASS